MHCKLAKPSVEYIRSFRPFVCVLNQMSREVVACAQDNTRGLTNGGTRTSQVQDQVRESRESARNHKPLGRRGQRENQRDKEKEAAKRKS